MMNIFYFDIETSPNKELQHLVDVDLDAPANYKDPVKIERWKAEAKSNAVAKMALDPDLAQIRAISVLWDGVYYYCSTEFFDSDLVQHNGAEVNFVLKNSETEILEWFFSFVTALETTNNVLCTYSGLKFDIPMLVRRAMDLKVKIGPRAKIIRTYQNGVPLHTWLNLVVFDLYQEMGGEFGKAKSLKFYVRKYKIPKRFGIDNSEIPDGKDSLEMSAHALAEYSLNDVFYLEALMTIMLDYYL